MTHFQLVCIWTASVADPGEGTAGAHPLKNVTVFAFLNKIFSTRMLHNKAQIKCESI